MTGFGGAPGGSGSGGNGKNQEDQAAQQEEMKRQMLSRILDAEARERRELHLTPPFPYLFLSRRSCS